MDQNIQAGSDSAGIKYGGFWIRLLASLVDGILLLVLLSPITGWSFSNYEISSTYYPVQVLIGWLYSAVLESSNKQATVGKMIFGLRVTDNNGNRISFGRATGRHFAKIISGFILGIGFIMIAFTDKKRGLHDMIAGTLVVYKK